MLWCFQTWTHFFCSLCLLYVDEIRTACFFSARPVSFISCHDIAIKMGCIPCQSVNKAKQKASRYIQKWFFSQGNLASPRKIVVEKETSMIKYRNYFHLKYGQGCVNYNEMFKKWQLSVLLLCKIIIRGK